MSSLPARTLGEKFGWGATIIVGLFLLMDAGMKLAQPAVVIETNLQLGWTANYVAPLGVLLLGIAILYLVPRTNLLGAILLTGYLGGAIATHMRMGSPLFTHTLFGLYVGMLAWLGVFLRNKDFRRALGLN